jgi:hypothetical protein
MDRVFTDPFTGDVLEDPTRKTYDVEYSVRGGSGTFVQEVNTLAEGRLTKAQAKEKISPMVGPPRQEDITIKSITKIDEDAAGAPGPF